jgi:hypothetical protein
VLLDEVTGVRDADAVAAAHQVVTDLLRCSREVAGRLEGDRRHRHRFQLPGQQEPRQELGVCNRGGRLAVGRERGEEKLRRG